MLGFQKQRQGEIFLRGGKTLLFIVEPAELCRGEPIARIEIQRIAVPEFSEFILVGAIAFGLQMIGKSYQEMEIGIVGPIFQCGAKRYPGFRRIALVKRSQAIPHKLAILLSLSYGKRVHLDDLHREGIASIGEQDIAFAGELGYRIKLLAIAIRRGEFIEARLHPTMIPFSHLLANVNSNFNAFHIIGDAADSVFLYGQGAGMMPTASAVISDVVDIARDVIKGVAGRVPPRVLDEEKIIDIKLLPFDEIVTNYYFRFSVADRPGVLSRISGILGQNNISIAVVIQKGRRQDGAVPIVMTTYKAQERDVQKALADIDRLDVAMGKTMLIRVEDDKLS